jgi:hypothetical protein
MRGIAPASGQVRYRLWIRPANFNARLAFSEADRQLWLGSVMRY